METADAVGFVFFVGTVAIYAFILLGCMERRLKRLDREVKHIEEESKYVN